MNLLENRIKASKVGGHGDRNNGDAEKDESEDEDDDEDTSPVFGLEAMVDFLLEQCKSHVDLIFPQAGEHAWLRSNLSIDAAAQAAWFEEGLMVGAGSGFPSLLQALTQSVVHILPTFYQQYTGEAQRPAASSLCVGSTASSSCGLYKPSVLWGSPYKAPPCRYCDDGGSQQPLVLLGGSGAGKTALLRQFLAFYVDATKMFPSVKFRQARPARKGWRHGVLHPFTSILILQACNPVPVILSDAD